MKTIMGLSLPQDTTSALIESTQKVIELQERNEAAERAYFSLEQTHMKVTKSLYEQVDSFRAEITKLHETIAAQASEIESLRISYDAACMLVAQMHEAVMGEVIGPYHGVVEDVRNKVAAQAAAIETLKSALTYVIEDIELRASLKEDEDERGVVDIGDGAYDQAKAALAIPTDSTQILDEVRRAERERQLAEIPLDDIKQALTKYSEILVHVDCSPVYRKHLVEILDKAQAAIRAME